jgi:type IV secretory pathway TrbF-like protein
LLFIEEGFVTATANPYLAARREWDERYGDQIRRARNWRTACLLSNTAMLLAVAGLVWLASGQHFAPYVVAVDALNRPLAAGYAGQTAIDERARVASIQSWIENVRLVTSDVEAQRRAIDLVYGHIASGSAAQAFVTEFDRANDPFARSRSESVSVELNSVLSTGDRSYQVDWIETTRDLNGGLKSKEHWKASVAIAINPPKDERTARVNPFGVYITNASWSRVL